MPVALAWGREHAAGKALQKIKGGEDGGGEPERLAAKRVASPPQLNEAVSSKKRARVSLVPARPTWKPAKSISSEKAPS